MIEKLDKFDQVLYDYQKNNPQPTATVDLLDALLNGVWYCEVCGTENNNRTQTCKECKV